MGEIGNKTVFDDDLVFFIQKTDFGTDTDTGTDYGTGTGTEEEIPWLVVSCDSALPGDPFCAGATALSGDLKSCIPQANGCTGADCFKSLSECINHVGFKSFLDQFFGGTSSSSSTTSNKVIDCRSTPTGQINPACVNYCGVMDENRQLTLANGFVVTQNNCQCGYTDNVSITHPEGATGCKGIGCRMPVVKNGACSDWECIRTQYPKEAQCEDGLQLSPLLERGVVLPDCPHSKIAMIKEGNMITGFECKE